MRLVIPISRHDSHLLPQWAEVVKHLGCGQQHDLHIVTPESIEGEVREKSLELDGHFLSKTIHTIEIEPLGGWPYGPNNFFWHAALFMFQNNPNAPWLFNELDCLPTRPNTYDAIGSHYMNSGRPFFGFVSETPGRDLETGKIMGAPYGRGDVMMSGCGVYPGSMMAMPGFMEKNNSGMMADLMKGDQSTDEPWDIHLRSQMRAAGLGHTDLIASHWNTVNYRVENGGLVCDDSENHEFYKQHPEWEKRKCGGRVHPNAILIHGCKDDSLANLILSEGIPEATMRRPSPQTAQATFAPQTSQSAPPSNFVTKEELQNFGQNLMQNFGDVLRDALKGNKEQKKGPAPITPEIASQPEPEGIWPVISRKLAARKWRLKDLASAVQLPPDQLQELLSGKGYETNGPAQWIKEKQAASVS